MGLLDMFNDPQSAGLLGAGAQILERSGDTSRPYGLGQAMGTGISSYMQINNSMRARKQQEEQERAQQAMREMQMQEMQAEMAQKERAQAEAARLQQFYTGRSAPGAGGAPQSGAASPSGAQQPAPGGQQGGQPGGSLYESMMQEAQALQAAGFIPQAQAKMKEAISVRPKYATEGRTVMGPDGKPMLVQMADDGNVRPIQGGYGAAEKLHFGDNGQNLVGMDQYTGQVKSSIGKQQTPESLASERSAAAGRAQSASQFGQRLAFDKQQAAGSEDSSLDPLSTRLIAQQYLAGDGQALANIGRGNQGAKNMVKVRDEIARQANSAGMNGADIAAKMAEFGGLKAGQRTVGTRSASIEIAAQEAAELAPLALEASQKVARSGILPFGKMQVMFDSNTNNPDLRQFAMANNALANAFGQVMSRGGVATVSDKEHAKELLSTAFDQKSYAAAVQQLQAEIRAAQKAPKSVRNELSAATSGRESGHGAPPAQAARPVMDAKPVANTSNKGRILVENETGKRFRSNGMQWVEIQ